MNADETVRGLTTRTASLSGKAGALCLTEPNLLRAISPGASLIAAPLGYVLAPQKPSGVSPSPNAVKAGGEMSLREGSSSADMGLYASFGWNANRNTSLPQRRAFMLGE